MTDKLRDVRQAADYLMEIMPLYGEGTKGERYIQTILTHLTALEKEREELRAAVRDLDAANDAGTCREVEYLLNIACEKHAASRTLVPELVAEIRRLREVLAWYGDNYNNYKYDVTKHDPAFDCAIDEDDGQRARDAIGGVDDCR